MDFFGGRQPGRKVLLDMIRRRQQGRVEIFANASPPTSMAATSIVGLSATRENVAGALRANNTGYSSICLCSSFRTRDITIPEFSGGSSDSPSLAAARAFADWPAAR